MRKYSKLEILEAEKSADFTWDFIGQKWMIPAGCLFVSREVEVKDG